MTGQLDQPPSKSVFEVFCITFDTVAVCYTILLIFGHHDSCPCFLRRIGTLANLTNQHSSKK